MKKPIREFNGICLPVLLDIPLQQSKKKTGSWILGYANIALSYIPTFVDSSLSPRVIWL